MSEELSEIKYWIYHQNGPVSSKLAYLDRVCTEYDNTLRMMIVNCEEDLEQVLESRSPSEYSWEVVSSQNRTTSLEVTRVIESSEKVYRGKFLAIKSEYEDTYAIISHENRDVFRKGIKRFLEQYYPIVSRPFVSSRRIKEIWDKIEAENETEVRTDRLVAYENKISSDREEKQEANVKYTDEHYLESFRKVVTDDMYIDKWDVKSSGDRSASFTGFVSRRSILKCEEGMANFYKYVVREIERHSARQNELFEDRERSEDKDSEPLIIEYDNSVFEDTEMNQKLIESINETTNVSCSVYHGNPYLYMSVVDYQDGSSFDIIVHSEDQIKVVPQMRGNPASISRIVNSIFQNFGEGRVKEA